MEEPVRLWRAHGLGNDYLVLERGGPLTPARVQAICDRHTGVGGDGVLEPADPGPADHGVTIWNPDGSVAEKSGNGLRIFAAWLHRAGHASPFSVWTGHDTVICTVDGDRVTVEMGRARCTVETPLVDGPEAMVVVDVGNPHCVLFVDTPPDTVPWRAWGQALETHPRFPNRTNVQVTDGGLHVRIWERGAGPTQASGSSACAVVAAAVHTGRRAPGRHPVHMPGGVLHVTTNAALDLVLEGPVAPVATIDIDQAWLTSLRVVHPGR